MLFEKRREFSGRGSIGNERFFRKPSQWESLEKRDTVRKKKILVISREEGNLMAVNIRENGSSDGNQ